MVEIFKNTFLVFLLLFCSLSFLFIHCDSKNSNIDVLNLQGDSLDLNKLINYNKLNIVVLLSLPTCHECCVQLNSVLNQIMKENNDIGIYAIISSDNNVLSRRMDMNYFKQFFSSNIQYYFIPKNNSNNYSGLFYLNGYKIKHTPSLLLMSLKKELFINYDELFGNNDFSSQKLLKIIQEFR